MVRLQYRTTVRAITVENFLYYEAEERGTSPCRCTVELKVRSSSQHDDHFPCLQSVLPAQPLSSSTNRQFTHPETEKVHVGFGCQLGLAGPWGTSVCDFSLTYRL